jgi:hypothetical protein
MSTTAASGRQRRTPLGSPLAGSLRAPVNPPDNPVPGWSKAAASRIVWFQQAIDQLPTSPYSLSRGIVVVDPNQYYAALSRDILAGWCGPRGHVLADDLETLRLLHGPKRDDFLRPTSRERGYSPAWDKLRKEFAAENPFCVVHLAQGVEVPVWEVHHEPALIGPGDPGLLDRSRLRSLCRSCHAKRTNQDRRRIAG